LFSVNFPLAADVAVLGAGLAEAPSVAPVAPVVPSVDDEPVPFVPPVASGDDEVDGLEVATGATTSGANGSLPVASALCTVGTLVGLADAFGVGEADAAADALGAAWCVTTGPLAAESFPDPEPKRK
jgi:hypothetical protein